VRLSRSVRTSSQPWLLSEWCVRGGEEGSRSVTDGELPHGSGSPAVVLVFDNARRLGQDRFGNSKADAAGGSEIEHHGHLGLILNAYFRRIFALQHAVGDVGRLSAQLVVVDADGGQRAVLNALVFTCDEGQASLFGD